MSYKNVKIWKSDADWSKIESDSAALLISQSESRLQSTLEAISSSVKRTEMLLTIAIGLITISAGYLFTGNDAYLKEVSFFATIILVACVLYLYQNIHPYTAYSPGLRPSEIYCSNFINEFHGTDQYKCYTHYILQVVESKILENEKLQENRVKWNAKARICLMLLPTSFIIAAIYHYFLGYYLVWVR